MVSQSSEILYGVHPVLELLRAGGRPVDKLYLLKGRGGGLLEEIIRLSKAQGITLHFESKAVLDRVASTEKHQGVVALVAAKAYDTPEDLIKIAHEKNQPPLVLLLDGVEDPRNLGAIVRTAEAAGVHGIILPRHRSVGLTGAVVKASAGALEYLPMARVVNLGRTMEELKREGLWIVGLEPTASQPYTELDYKGPTGVVVGGEGRGIREGLLRHCDHLVSIPMKGRVESLNVSVAVAILLYEILRQREGGKVG
jgi:23S rRNA (guanosine2251-2'-O)-methyltransferase